MSLTAIVGATVIDGTGRDPIIDAILLVEDDRVLWVMPTADAQVPDEAVIVDAEGKYVIPGLMDANVHLCSDLPDVLLEHEGHWDDLILEAAQVTLQAGVTTVFDTWGPLESLVKVRDALASGDLTGSRIFLAGNIIGLAGPLSNDFFPPGFLIGPDTIDRINAGFEQGVGAELLGLTPDEVRARVREYVETSAIDFVKYAASGHGSGLWNFITFSEPVQKAIVEEGHRAGLTVQAHTSTPESLRMEIEAGADLLQHGDETGTQPIPESTLKVIVDKQLPVAALVCTQKHVSWAQLQEGSERCDLVVVKDVNDRRLIDAGARMLLTTDGLLLGPRVLRHPVMAASTKDVPDVSIRLGDSHFLWLEAVIERGMNPMEALMSSSRYVAEAYGLGDELGSLEPGKRADLVILDANPFEDVHNYRRISRVMKDGMLIEPATLPTHPILTETP